MHYHDNPSWQTYHTILREEFDLAISAEPTERWCTVRGHDIHIDDWAARDPDCADQSLELENGLGEATAPLPRGTVVLVHGGGGNGRVLAPFADAIAGMGWRVIAPDLPGFGLTRPRADWRGDYAEWPMVVADIAQERGSDEYTSPVVLMGLSMGGLTAAYAAGRMKHPAGVIATTLLDLSEPRTFIAAARWRPLGLASLLSARATPFLMDRLSLPLALAAPLQTMSANARMADYFQTDPLLGRRWVPLSFWRTAHNYGPPPSALPCDLLLVHPGADAWTSPEASRRTFRRITTSKHHVLLDEGSHLPVESGAFKQLNAEIATFLRNREK